MAVRFTPAADLDAKVRTVTAAGRRRVAAAVVVDAKRLAPVDSGRFRDSFGVESSGEDVTVVNTDPAARYINDGTIDTIPHLTMQAAARRHGTLR